MIKISVFAGINKYMIQVAENIKHFQGLVVIKRKVIQTKQY
jgi:hypothetical protein